MIEELRTLWLDGVEVVDNYKQERFNLRAMLFCTINDFPAYKNLSGYSVKCHNAYPICMDDTSYCQLKHGKKTVYLGHRRFLKPNHNYRRLTSAFNGVPEHRSAPNALTGEQVYDKVKDIRFTLGKYPKQKQATESNTSWKKKSIFWDLPYWSDLDVRHSIDIMHVEKNVCDNIIGTLLNIKGKTKDGIKSRTDLMEMGI